MTLNRLLGCLVLVLTVCTACAARQGGNGASLADHGSGDIGTDVETPAGTSKMLDIRPGLRPALDTDEAGLWMAMDRGEEKLKTSGNLVRDEALNEYVSGIVCTLAGPHCPDIRTYVVRVPHFNASMAPNGVMQVWTGLILRTHNEAQLATVLGHEIAHYLRRHSLQRFRDVKDTANFLIFFQMATAAAGVPVAGNVASLIAMGSLMAFSRDQEREADGMGLRSLAEAGYDPREAVKVWDNLIREEEADEDKETRFLFFATHPPPEERSETLQRLAEQAIKDEPAGKTGRDTFHAVVLPHRAKYLRDELHLRRFSRTEELLKILLEDGANTGELGYFQGELYRLRGEEGDPDKALEAYRKALQAGQAPPQIHRSMGLVYLKLGEQEKARASFSKYLELVPDASDREMIRSMMGRIA